MENVRRIVKRVWGYDALLPLQEEAIGAVLARRDSIVILPTGGGKSLCYQAPAAAMGKLAVVVSPLISLMKDQVDGLTAAGVPAAFLNSSLTAEERRRVEAGVARGQVPPALRGPGAAGASDLPGVAAGGPAWRSSPSTRRTASASGGTTSGRSIASSAVLREAFPDVAIHAFTATATPRVRTDIAAELALRDPAILVGSFDRPNLVYRVRQRTDRLRQVTEALERHRGEAGIIYCIRRAEVDQLAEALRRRGIRAVAYHAGLADAERKRAQDDFITERADVVVATVAFGMGIDRSDVRFVIHAGMPKSIEHYQQEAGRAGRDGLPAECLLLYSGGDFGLWRSILMAEGLPAPGAIPKLGEMYDYCQRRRLPAPVPGGVLRPVLRRGAVRGLRRLPGRGDDRGRLGGAGGADPRLRRRDGGAVRRRLRGGCPAGGRDRPDRQDAPQPAGGLRSRCDRSPRRPCGAGSRSSKAQGCLAREGDEYPTLAVTAQGHRVLRGEETVSLLRTVARPARAARPARPAVPSAAGGATSDEELFETLRALRRTMAEERGIPPYLIFSDASLREMARERPTTEDAFLQIKGVGLRKLQELGPRFLACIREQQEERANTAPSTP